MASCNEFMNTEKSPAMLALDLVQQEMDALNAENASLRSQLQQTQIALKTQSESLDQLLGFKNAAHLVVNTWSAQLGRVFESMGRDNPRAVAIDDAINELRSALLEKCPAAK